MKRSLIYLALFICIHTFSNSQLIMNEWKTYSDGTDLRALGFNPLGVSGGLLTLDGKRNKDSNEFNFSKFSPEQGAKIFATVTFPYMKESISNYFLYKDTLYFNTFTLIGYDTANIAYYKVGSDNKKTLLISKKMPLNNVDNTQDFYADSCYYSVRQAQYSMEYLSSMAKFDRYGNLISSKSIEDTVKCITKADATYYRDKTGNFYIVLNQDLSSVSRTQINILKLNPEFDFIKKYTINSDKQYYYLAGLKNAFDGDNFYITCKQILENTNECFSKKYTYSLSQEKLIAEKTGPADSVKLVDSYYLIVPLQNNRIFVNGRNPKTNAYFNRIYNANYELLYSDSISKFRFSTYSISDNGRIFLTGTLVSNDGDFTYEVVELNPNISSVEAGEEPLIITSFPNPSSNYADISVPESVAGKACVVSVYSYTGAKIYEEFIEDLHSLRLKVSDYPVGAYTVVLTTPDRTIPVKIAVQR